MSDILADYREWRDQQAARVSTHSAGCHMWHRDCMIHRIADALEKATLTDAEREAVAWFSNYSDTPGEERHAVVLAKLLERTK
jgi:hypothetical protein